MSEILVKELDEVIARLQKAREAYDEKKRVASEAYGEVEKLENQCVAYLKETGRKNYASPLGTIYVIQKSTVKIPQSNDEKLAFFGWAKERGIFEKYATVHHHSLQALYREAEEQAKAQGEMLSIPGIGLPTLTETLGFRKG